MNKKTSDYECPACTETITIDNSKRTNPSYRVSCPHYNETYTVNTDVDFIDGRQVDITTLHFIENEN